MLKVRLALRVLQIPMGQDNLGDTAELRYAFLLLQIVGRLASQLSLLLQGKDKPIFAPHKDLGDVCIVVNAEKAVFTGNKWEGKLYKWHTGKQAAGGAVRLSLQRQSTYVTCSSSAVPTATAWCMVFTACQLGAGNRTHYSNST